MGRLNPKAGMRGSPDTRPASGRVRSEMLLMVLGPPDPALSPGSATCCVILAKWLTFLSLGFLFCKVGMIKIMLSHVLHVIIYIKHLSL